MLGVTITRRFYSTKRAHECYRILNVKRDAGPDEIKERYFKLSRIFHPDNTETGNVKKFIKIRDAYEFIQTAPLNPRCNTEDFRDHLSHASMVESEEKSGEWSQNFVETDINRLYGTGLRPNIWKSFGRIARGTQAPSIDKSKMSSDEF